MIRLDDVVLLGPGSEWFWTFVQAIALTITFVAIYRQLRSARSAAEFEQVREIEAEFYSARLTRARLSLYEQLRGRKPEEGLPAGAIDVLCWYDNLGYLVAAGHLSADWFHASWGASIQNEWWLLEPYRACDRIADEDPDYGKSFERLAHRMHQLDLQRRQPAVVHEDAERPAWIERYARLLHARLAFIEAPAPA
ncbi:MAG: hypothetical protein HYX55_00840 [Chloroflexi bacterium]|nr:hypothetical protein [Chloroflexota bacterium]